MRQPRHRSRLAVTVTGLLASAAAAGMFFGADPATAAVTGSAPGTTAVTSGSWGAEAGAVGATPAPGTSYVINWNLTGSIAYNYFQINNVGTLDLVAQTYSAVNQRLTSNGSAPPAIGLDACVGAAWNQLLGTCSGTVVRITATTQSATAASISIAAGSALSMRAVPITHPNFPQPYTTTIDVTVTRSQARAATTGNN